MNSFSFSSPFLISFFLTSHLSFLSPISFSPISSLISHFSLKVARCDVGGNAKLIADGSAEIVALAKKGLSRDVAALLYTTDDKKALVAAAVSEALIAKGLKANALLHSTFYSIELSIYHISTCSRDNRTIPQVCRKG